MSNVPPETPTTDAREETKPITPWRCLSASLISGPLAIASYFLTVAVVQTYAHKPIEFNNAMAVNIASTVRTLIIGITTLATFVFAMVTVGLIALAIKLIIDRQKSKPLN